MPMTPPPTRRPRREPERIAVLGLGRMGLPIVRRLASAGLTVAVFDPRADRAAAAKEDSSLVVARDAGSAAEGADVVVTVLPGPDELSAAMTGDPARDDAGLLPLLERGTTWVDLTSNDPRVATRLAAAAEERGILVAAAPMIGGPSDAEAGSLGFYLGGDDDAVAVAETVLRPLGDPAANIRTGPDVASATTTKLLANALWFTQVVSVTEMMLLGQRLGLDATALRQSLARGPASSAFITRHLDQLLAGDYLPAFDLGRVVDELQTVVELADEQATPHAIAGLAAQVHEEALERFGAVPGEMLAARLLEEQAATSLSGGRSPAH